MANDLFDIIFLTICWLNEDCFFFFLFLLGFVLLILGFPCALLPLVLTDVTVVVVVDLFDGSDAVQSNKKHHRKKK